MTKKLRPSQIVLDTPVENADVFVRVTIQKVVKDGNYATVQTVDRVDAVNRTFAQYGTQTHTFTDPVLGTKHTLSGSGLGMAIGEFVKAWMLQDIEGTSRNARGDIVQE